MYSDRARALNTFPVFTAMAVDRLTSEVVVEVKFWFKDGPPMSH